MAAGLSVGLDRWRDEFGELMLRIGSRFARVEPRRRMAAFVAGLLAGLPRVNCWSIAEHAGDAGPRGMQRLLSEAVWDEAGVRDDLRGYVLEHFADPGAVLVVDETGFLKKGTTSVGVQRQYSGTAGKVENCQLGVFLAYASAKGRAMIDRELYLPESWTDDPERCRAARVPEAIRFRTKPELAQLMVERALDAGVPAAWVTADEVYGGSPSLRRWLEGRGVWHVLAVKCTELLAVDGPQGPMRQSAGQLAAGVPAEQWIACSAGHGAKGRRLYDWTRIELASPVTSEMARWLLVRRSRRDGELAFYTCYGPAGTSLVGLVRVAGTRWAVEEGFEQAKGEVGLDHYEVRKWPGWYRHITLAPLAHAFLAVTRAQAVSPERAKGDAAA
jgi:SRSO17 transposase